MLHLPLLLSDSCPLSIIYPISIHNISDFYTPPDASTPFLPYNSCY
ncbi:hypothetical protein GCWU000342_01240 [Shuttleworthella satelles DSM 14600]|uniref:Uncharacterized protein n=1 Tax=Shuttleworthella satelles DSM 14600 TaxID=626523 RepID=C4GBE0_9FIRM|nr:hypothetical protein GCWU000342_01240 [Shuttleworthia satelles DSM 14600]